MTELSDTVAIQAMVDRLTLDLAQERAKREAAERELESFRSRDTERPTSKSGALLELADSFVRMTDHVDVNFGRITREMEQVNRRINEIPDEVRAASREGAANAVIELVTRLEVLEDWRRKRDAACHGCPKLDAAAGS